VRSLPHHKLPRASDSLATRDVCWHTNWLSSCQRRWT